MQLPLQVTFRHMETSDALLADIEEKAEKLDRFSDQIMACRVVVEAPHQHHRKGKLFHVSIDLTVPGGEIVASRSADEHHAHEDVYVAVRDAFNAVKRQLEDHMRKQRHKVKQHTPPPHGRILKLFPEEDYGIIAGADGKEVYFHRNSVLQGQFDELQPDSEVRFAEELGEEGPQASTVVPVGKHHIVE
jgi:ribosomal subunit interface protein